MSLTFLSASMIACNLWTIVNSVTPDQRLGRSELWMTASVSQSIAKVARREFGEHKISNHRNHPIGIHLRLRSKAYCDGRWPWQVPNMTLTD